MSRMADHEEAYHGQRVEDVKMIPFEQDQEQEDQAAEKPGAPAGLRGLRFSSALMLLFWAMTMVLKYESLSTTTSTVKCGLNEEAMADNNIDVEQECVQQTAVFRVSAVLMLLLSVQAALCLFSTHIWDDYWLIKLPTFAVLAFIVLYSSNDTSAFLFSFFDDRVFAWIARFGAFAFVLLQSLIFLDWAYTFNESMVGRALEASGGSSVYRLQKSVDGLTGMGKSSGRLVCLLVFAAINLSGFGVAMGYLFSGYGGEGCSDNKAILAISIVLVILAVVTQLDGSRGSVTTTGVLSLYVAYTSYCAVALNPNPECNANLSADSEGLFGLGPVVLGIACSFASITYITLFAVRKIASLVAAGPLPFTRLIGVVVGYTTHGGEEEGGGKDKDLRATNVRVLVLNLNVVFLLVTCYISMVATNWGSIAGFASVGASTDGLAELATSIGAANMSMYLNAVAGWLAAVMYILALCIPTWSDCIPTSVWDLKFRSG